MALSTWVARAALLLVLVPAAINAATGPSLVISAPEAASLPATTSDDLRAAMAVEERLVGVLITGFSLLAIGFAWLHHRRPSFGTTAGLVVVAGTFAALTTVLAFAGGRLTMYYGIQTILVIAGAALAAMSVARASTDAEDAASA